MKVEKINRYGLENRHMTRRMPMKQRGNKTNGNCGRRRYAAWLMKGIMPGLTKGNCHWDKYNINLILGGIGGMNEYFS